MRVADGLAVFVIDGDEAEEFVTVKEFAAAFDVSYPLPLSLFPPQTGAKGARNCSVDGRPQTNSRLLRNLDNS